MRFLLLTISFFSLTIAVSQQIEWGDLEKNTGQISSLVPVSGSTFFTTRWSGGAFLKGSPYLAHHINFSVVSEEQIQTKVISGTAEIEQIIAFNSQVIVFLSDKKEGTNTLYMQKYNDQCLADGDPVELTSYRMPPKWNKGDFNVFQSQDHKFLCVEYSVPATKKEGRRFGFKIINERFETISKGEYDSKPGKVTNRFLVNTGDYFFTSKIYSVTKKKGLASDIVTLDKIVLTHVTPDTTEDMDLKLDGKQITDLKLSSDNIHMLTCTGLYGEIASNGATSNTDTKGIVYFRLDFEKKQLLNVIYDEFSTEFITEGWSEKEKKQAGKKESRGKGAPVLFSYDIRDSSTLPDGSMVGIIEQYYVRVITSRDSKTGATTTNYYYYYNDVIAYKVSPEGKFEWVKKIIKRQVSANDGGYLSSVAEYITNDKIVILFNDNLKNYDVNGNFVITGKGILPVNYRVGKNCVARVELDVNTGEGARKTFFTRAEEEAMAVPKLFKADYANKEMLIVLETRKKEKFGLLKF